MTKKIFRNIKEKLEDKWMNIVDKFNTNAKKSNTYYRWSYKTIWAPLWWVVGVTIAYLIALFLTGSEFELDALVSRMIVGYIAYSIGMVIQYLYVAKKARRV